LVAEEASAGDVALAKLRLKVLSGMAILEANRIMIEQADDLVRCGSIPRKATRDALHTAIAAAYGCDYLLTWNCRHIANAEICRSVRGIVESQGFELPTICTPGQLMGDPE